MGGTSRISREAYVRFCERLGVRFPGSTRRPQLSSWGSNHANPRLVDLSSLTPSGGGLRADPVQKHDPGERISRKSENEGLTYGPNRLGLMSSSQHPSRWERLTTTLDPILAARGFRGRQDGGNARRLPQPSTPAARA